MCNSGTAADKFTPGPSHFNGQMNGGYGHSDLEMMGDPYHMPTNTYHDMYYGRDYAHHHHLQPPYPNRPILFITKKIKKPPKTYEPMPVQPYDSLFRNGGR